jgi:hypothetical protein
MARAFGHQVLAVIVQQPDLERLLVQERDRQRLDPFADRVARDRDRVDLIRLARPPLAPARLAHQPRRHPHHALALTNQTALQAPRHMPAVLERPHPLPAPKGVRLPPPGKHALGVRAHRARRHDPARRRLHRSERMRALVRVRADHDH